MILALLLSLRCDPSFWAHTYHHKRFTVISRCKSFTGTIEHQRREADGDIHIQVRLDPGQGKPLTHANMVRQNGCLVVEPVCIGKVTQKDAIRPCKGASKIAIPPTGAHVKVTGVYVLDNQHGGWAEIHAASSITPQQ